MVANTHAYEGVFYCTYQNDECVESNAPVNIEKTEMAELLEKVGAVEKNFIGFTDKDGITLQFYVDTINDIWVEIPIPSEEGSYGKQITESEMQSIISELTAPYIRYKTELNLSFRAW